MKRKSFIVICSVLCAIIVADIAIFFSLYFKKNLSFIEKRKTTIENKSREFFDTCAAHANKTACYQDLFATFTSQHSLQEALILLQRLAKLDPSVKYCHPYAHKIAQEEVRKDPDKWLSVLENIDPFACTRGFFHGVIEAHIGSNPNFRLNAQTIKKICGIVQGDSKANLAYDTSCSHATGHLLLVQTKGNIPEAISICSSLDDLNQYGCAEGVFMEDSNRENLVEHGIAERKKWDKNFIAERETYCRTYQGKIASACYVTLADLYASVYEGDKVLLFSLCERAPTAFDKKRCFFEAAAFSTFLSVSRGNKREDLCDVLKDDKQYDECVSFISTYLTRSLFQFPMERKPF